MEGRGKNVEQARYRQPRSGYWSAGNDRVDPLPLLFKNPGPVFVVTADGEVEVRTVGGKSSATLAKLMNDFISRIVLYDLTRQWNNRRLETGGDGGDFRYHFSNTLEPKYVFPSGSHEFTHLSLETRGAITHSWSDCPELQAPLILQTWEPDSGWYEQPIRWRDNPWKEV